MLEIEEFDLGKTLEGGSAALASALKEYDAQAWLNFGASAETLAASYDAAAEAGVERLVTLVDASAPDADAIVAASKRAQDGVSRTLIVTGTVVDGNEGGALATSLLRKARPGVLKGSEVVRDDAVRVAAEAFVIKGAQNASFTLAKGSDADAKYLRYLRESGADRQEEIDALIAGDRSAFVDVENKRKEKEKRIEEKRKKEEAKYERSAPFRTCPNGTIVTVEQFELDFKLMKQITDEKIAQKRKEEVCTRARGFLETEFEKFLYGRRDRGHTFEPYVKEHWNRGVYEVSVRMNLIPRDEYIETEKKRWQRWIGKSMRCPPQLKAIFPEIYPADEWDDYNAIVSDDVVHVSSTGQ